MKKISFIFLLALLSLAASAEVVEYDGLWYNLNTVDNTAEVIASQGVQYSGDVSIPSMVYYQNKYYSVTSIGESAFEGCTGLTSITISSSVKSLEKGAFYGCSGLTSVKIPNGVTKIGLGAFSVCTNLISVFIPSSVTDIESYAFDYCNNLNWIVSESDQPVPFNNTVFDTHDESYNVYSMATLVIPDGTKNVYESTAGWSNFTTISAFSEVTIDTPVEIDGIWYILNNLDLSAIATWNRSQTDYSGNIVIPSVVTYNGVVYTVTKIDDHAFRSSISSITIPNTVLEIGDYAFCFCQKLSYVNIGNGVVLIGKSAFSRSALCSVTIPNSVTDIGEEAFSWCSSLKSASFGNCVKSIGKRAFEECRNLSSIKIPDGITSINEETFQFCTSLSSVTIPSSVSSIENRAFSGCSGLNSIIIPNGVKSIGVQSFWGCSNIKTITIANTVTTIDRIAFSGCSSLASLTIPESVTFIGDGAFSDCGSLSAINVEKGNANYDSRGNCNAIIETKTNTLLRGCGGTTIPSSVSSIGDYAFSGCSNLTSMKIPNSVLSIGNHAFYSCQSLISVEIPNSTTSIGSYAFAACKGLKTIVIPNSLVSIGRAAFLYTAWYDNQPDGMVYAGKVAYGYKGDMPLNTSVTLQDGTMGIAGYAFELTNNMSSIKIPSTVITIGENAFYSCSKLLKIESDIVKPFIIDSSVFSWIPTSAMIIVPIGSKTLYESTDGWNLRKIVEKGTSSSDLEKRTIHVATAGTLPNIISTYEKHAVEELKLTGVINGTDVKLLKNMPLLKILDMSEVQIVHGGDSYYESREDDPDDWGEKIYVPHYTNDNILSMYFFGNGLTSIAIPNSVTSIQSSAFSGCNNLTCIISGITSPFAISNVASSDLYSKVFLFVPQGTKAAYESTPGWKEFQNIVEIGEGGIVGQIIKVDNVNYKIGENNTMSVTKSVRNQIDENFGDLVIHAQVSYNGKNYIVTSSL